MPERNGRLGATNRIKGPYLSPQPSARVLRGWSIHCHLCIRQKRPPIITPPYLKAAEFEKRNPRVASCRHSIRLLLRVSSLEHLFTYPLMSGRR